MIKLPTTLKGRLAAAVLSLSMAGAGAIVAHEGMKKVAYVDPVGVVTVCAGHTKTAQLGQIKTDAQCAELLKQDVKYAEAAVRRLVTAPVTQSQFDALVSFVFNVGEGNFAKSTLLKKVNAKDCLGAGAEFSRWNRAGGKVLAGLTKRRNDERKLWETGCATKTVKQVAKRTAHIEGLWVQARRPEYAFGSLLAHKA